MFDLDNLLSAIRGQSCWWCHSKLLIINNLKKTKLYTQTSANKGPWMCCLKDVIRSCLLWFYIYILLKNENVHI